MLAGAGVASPEVPGGEGGLTPGCQPPGGHKGSLETGFRNGPILEVRLQYHSILQTLPLGMVTMM